jgi:hypothetical protein
MNTKSIIILISVISTVLILAILIKVSSGFHIIKDRHVGIYYISGKLLPEYTVSGRRNKLPITDVYQIEIGDQTDFVETVLLCV